MNEKRWHKDSRYWRLGLPVVYAFILLAAVAIVWAPETATTAISAAGAVATVFLGAAGGTNVAERLKATQGPGSDRTKENAP